MTIQIVLSDDLAVFSFHSSLTFLRFVVKYQPENLQLEKGKRVCHNVIDPSLV